MTFPEACVINIHVFINIYKSNKAIVDVLMLFFLWSLGFIDMFTDRPSTTRNIYRTCTLTVALASQTTRFSVTDSIPQ